MPYTLPGDPPDTDTITDPDIRKELTAEHRDRTQEREVRLTAQRILAHHLHPGPNASAPVETFWENIDLDLTGATLINFTLTNCTTRTARFDRATFTGHAGFIRATFTGYAGFNDATFTGPAGFGGATFTDEAGFNRATFTGPARFNRATFTGYAGFNDATFTGPAGFGGATFTGDANFGGATFTGNAGFSEATLPATRYVDRTTLSPWADFAGAHFAWGVPVEVAGFVSEDEAEGSVGNR